MAVQRQKRRVLVIGLGNQLSGDDGFGPRVIEYLRRHHPPLTDPADVVDGTTDILGHLEHFSLYSRMVLVDALLDPEARLGIPGELVVLEHDVLRGMRPMSPGVHAMSPLLAVQLFARLHPEAETRFTAVGLCTDRIALGRGNCLAENIIDRAVSLIHTICET